MAHGFLYLTAILDVASRKVLAFRLSNTLTTDFCIEALEEALAKFGAPDIFNTDQGSQFTSDERIEVLDDAGVAISMDAPRMRCISTHSQLQHGWRRKRCHRTRTPSFSRKAGDCSAWRRLTKSQEQENIISNRPGRSTYPQENSVLTSAVFDLRQSVFFQDFIEARP
jgi:hypothetical protein